MVNERFKSEIRISKIEANPNFQMIKIQNCFEHSNL
jgi:hypothetical protein